MLSNRGWTQQTGANAIRTLKHSLNVSLEAQPRKTLVLSYPLQLEVRFGYACYATRILFVSVAFQLDLHPMDDWDTLNARMCCQVGSNSET